MSAGSDNYIESYNPDANVVRFWYQKWHVEAEIEENKSAVSTQKTVEKAIERFERYLAAQSENHDCHWTDIPKSDISYNVLSPPPRSVTPQIAEQFLIALRDAYKPPTQSGTFTILKQAYDWCETSVEPVEINPFAKVKQKHKERNNEWILETPKSREPHIISLDEARNIVTNIKDLRFLLLQLLLVKYPRRAGEVSNLDMEDIHLEHPGCEWPVHRELRQWPDHILFRAEKRASESGRNSGNKTETTAKYPLDNELKQFLLAYLTIRPEPKSPDSPLIINTHGKRKSATAIGNDIIDNSRELGYWYEAHDDDNINAHYWRHWGTSWYEDQFAGDKDSDGYTALTDYLRGDSRGEIKALYNSYSEQKERRIIDAMMKFHEPFIED